MNRNEAWIWAASHLVAAGMPLTRRALYNAYRFELLHADPRAHEPGRLRVAHLFPDRWHRSSLLVLPPDHDLIPRPPYTWTEGEIPNAVRHAASSLALSHDDRARLQRAASDELAGARKIAGMSASLSMEIRDVRAWIWPHVQLYRRRTKERPGWIYLARLSEVRAVLAERQAAQERRRHELDRDADQARRMQGQLSALDRATLLAISNEPRNGSGWASLGPDRERVMVDIVITLRDRIRRMGTSDVDATLAKLEGRGMLECRRDDSGVIREVTLSRAGIMVLHGLV